MINIFQLGRFHNKVFEAYKNMVCKINKIKWSNLFESLQGCTTESGWHKGVDSVKRH